MSKEYGYIGKEVTQAFRSNKGIFTPQDIIELDQENKWTNFGQLELIQTQTVSSVATVDFTSIKENIYNVHFLTMIAEGGADYDILFSNDSGSSFETSNYQYGIQFGTSAGSFGEDRTTSDSKIMFTQGSANENGYAYFYNLGDSTKYSFLTNHAYGVNGTKFGSGLRTVAEVVNGIRIDGRTGNFTSAIISLYGIRFA
jgi:hypothetical protein